MRRKNPNVYSLLFTLLSGILAPRAWSQQISDADRTRAQQMLRSISADVAKHYYDSNLNGMDWNAKVAEAREKIDKSPSFGMAVSYIAAALDSLNDSHTFFIPPPRPYSYDYGFQTQVIGSQCYVTRVRPGSDAEAKGMRPGDEVEAINKYHPVRGNLWKINYVFDVLGPQNELRLTPRNPQGIESQINVKTKVSLGSHVKGGSGDNGGANLADVNRRIEAHDRQVRPRLAQLGNEVAVLKVREFRFELLELDAVMAKAHNCKALIIDLRGNRGGNDLDFQRFELSGSPMLVVETLTLDSLEHF